VYYIREGEALAEPQRLRNVEFLLFGPRKFRRSVTLPTSWPNPPEKIPTRFRSRKQGVL
jgi:hypothetical protein